MDVIPDMMELMTDRGPSEGGENGGRPFPWENFDYVGELDAIDATFDVGFKLNISPRIPIF